MKKIIDGKRYDTATAGLVAQWSNGYNMNDFKWCAEDLYKTKNGNWFVSGKGGAMSIYAESSGNLMTGGENLRPLTSDEARQWLEDHRFTDALEEHFPDAIQDA